jgi:gamma-polyglutamate biosynthesis protein CapA
VLAGLAATPACALAGCGGNGRVAPAAPVASLAATKATTVASAPSSPTDAGANAAMPATTAEPAATGNAPTAPAPAVDDGTVSFLAVGDILLSRLVAGRIAATHDPLLPFHRMAEVFRSVDFCFGNLEAPFSGRPDFSTSPANIFNTPLENVRGLREHHFTVLGLANNHMLDQGPAGMRFTLSYLREQGITTFGVGENEDEAWRGAVVEVRGIRIGFVGASYASVNDNGTLRNHFVARIDDEQRLAAALARLHGEADFVVATMHAGAEYNPRVVPTEERFAHRAVELGADLVLGAHPHVLHRVEQYHGKFLFYSLGNFIFDHEPLPRRQGLALRVHLRRAGAAPSQGRAPVALERIELLPVVIEDHSTPRPATPAEASEILASIGAHDAVLVP